MASTTETIELAACFKSCVLETTSAATNRQRFSSMLPTMGVLSTGSSTTVTSLLLDERRESTTELIEPVG